MIVFPNEVTFWDTGVRASTYELGENTIQPIIAADGVQAWSTRATGMIGTAASMDLPEPSQDGSKYQRLRALINYRNVIKWKGLL